MARLVERPIEVVEYQRLSCQCGQCGQSVSALVALRRHFKKVIKFGHGNNPILGQAFLDLIDEAEAQHRRWRETQDGAAYREWAEAFKLKLAQSLQQWLGLAGYAAFLAAALTTG